VLLVAAAFAAAPVTAWAEDEEKDEDEAHAEYTKGVEAAGEENWEEALGHFKKAKELGAPGAVLHNIAKCYDHMGQYHLALEYYEQYLEVPKAKKKKTQERIDEIKEMPSEFKLLTEPPGAEVSEEKEDGETERIGITPLEQTLEQGEYVFIITKQGYLEETVEIDAKNGEPFDIEIDLTSEDGEDSDDYGIDDEDDGDDGDEPDGEPLGIYVELGAGAALYPYQFVQYEDHFTGDIEQNEFKAGADVSLGGGWRHQFTDDIGIGVGLRVNFRTYELVGTDRLSGDTISNVSLVTDLLAVPSFHWRFHDLLTLEASIPLGFAWLVPTGKIDGDVKIDLINGFINGSNLLLFDLGIGAGLRIDIVKGLYATVEPIRLHILFPLAKWKNDVKTLFDIDIVARLGYAF
jgi:hypothetical protein